MLNFVPFDSNIEFVIAIGHKGQQIKEYLSHAHPNRKIKFVVFDLDGVFTDGKIYIMENTHFKFYNGN